MKITLQPTGRTFIANGAPARLWVGETEDGIALYAWITTLQPQTRDPVTLAAFDAAFPMLKPGQLAPTELIDIRKVI